MRAPKKKMILTALWLVLSAASIPVWGQITLRFQSTPRNVSGVYVVDSPVVLNQSLSVRHRGAATSYFVTFSAGQSGSFTARAALSAAGGQLLYQIYAAAGSSSILKDLSGYPSISEVLAGSLPASGSFQRADHTFIIVPGPAQFPLAGTYQDSVTIRLYEGTPASPGLMRASAVMNLKLTMNSVPVQLTPHRAQCQLWSAFGRADPDCRPAGALQPALFGVRLVPERQRAQNQRRHRPEPGAVRFQRQWLGLGSRRGDAFHAGFRGRPDRLRRRALPSVIPDSGIRHGD
jgi:spore coat protein U-like protein